MTLRRLFPTLLYEAEAGESLLSELAHSIRSLAADDEAGRRWSVARSGAGGASAV